MVAENVMWKNNVLMCSFAVNLLSRMAKSGMLCWRIMGVKSGKGVGFRPQPAAGCHDANCKTS